MARTVTTVNSTTESSIRDATSGIFFGGLKMNMDGFDSLARLPR